MNADERGCRQRPTSYPRSSASICGSGKLTLWQRLMDYIRVTREGGPVFAIELETKAMLLFGCKGTSVTARLRELSPDKIDAERKWNVRYLTKHGKAGAMYYTCSAEQYHVWLASPRGKGRRGRADGAGLADASRPASEARPEFATEVTEITEKGEHQETARRANAKGSRSSVSSVPSVADVDVQATLGDFAAPDHQGLHHGAGA